MAFFVVRVTLHDGIETDYERLHGAMAAQGFSRTIRGPDGIVYHLPWAEYCKNSNDSVDVTTEQAKAAAATTNRSYGVLTSLATAVSWFGLKRA